MPTSREDTRSPSERTEKARAAAEARWEAEVDPDGILPPDERRRRAEKARRAHFVEMGRKSGEARRAQSEVVAELLKRTRTDRGMTLVIDDPATIAKVARILAAGDAA